MRPSIIVDIDGTLADCSHRVHHIQDFSNDKEATFKADWDAFYADCMHDSAIHPTVELVKSLHSEYAIILVTGRSAKYRDVTEAWLLKHGIEFDLMLMRRHGDHTEDVIIKQDWLYRLRDGRLALPFVEAPQIAIEDRARVVKMWRDNGLICFQVDEGDF